jgi:hypothetical protein
MFRELADLNVTLPDPPELGLLSTLKARTVMPDSPEAPAILDALKRVQEAHRQTPVDEADYWDRLAAPVPYERLLDVPAPMAVLFVSKQGEKQHDFVRRIRERVERLEKFLASAPPKRRGPAPNSERNLDWTWSFYARRKSPREIADEWEKVTGDFYDGNEVAQAVRRTAKRLGLAAVSS